MTDGLRPALPAAGGRRRHRHRLRRRLQRAFLRFRPSWGVASVVAWLFAVVFFALTLLNAMYSTLFIQCSEQWRTRVYVDDVCRSVGDNGDAFAAASEAFFVVAVVLTAVVVVRRLRARR